MVADSVTPRLVVGLGNPGDEYAGTRHNAGFLVVDRILEKLRRAEAKPEHKYNCHLHTLRHAGHALVLAKPLTFMNLSGEAVAKLARGLEAAPAEILVVADFLDLPLGRLRMRAGGGAGGHRGVESVIARLGTDAFPRLWVGVGHPGARGGAVVDHVLSTWTSEERASASRTLDAAAEAVLMAVRSGVAVTMNRWNSWQAEADDLDTDGTREGERKP